jgi:hypothetical protein
MSPETVRILVGAIANDRVRDVLVELLLGTLTPSAKAEHAQHSPNQAGAQRSRGRPLKAQPRVAAQAHPRRSDGRSPAISPEALERKREKARRYAAKKRAAAKAARGIDKVAQPAAKVAKQSAPTNGGNGQPVANLSPQAFWEHAQRIEPAKPWLAVMREFGIKEGIAREAYRNKNLPPHVGPMAVTKFLALPASA